MNYGGPRGIVWKRGESERTCSAYRKPTCTWDANTLSPVFMNVPSALLTRYVYEGRDAGNDYGLTCNPTFAPRLNRPKPDCSMLDGSLILLLNIVSVMKDLCVYK